MYLMDSGYKSTVTLRIGQAVVWGPAPIGFAQIDELMRRRVRLIYRAKSGGMKRPVVNVNRVASQPMLLDLNNPFDRAERSKSKTYRIG
jgi:hypothetical protein